MKKIHSVLLALTMLFALCIPAFAEGAMAEVTHKGAREILNGAYYFIEGLTPEQTNAALKEKSGRDDMIDTTIRPALTWADFAEESYRQESVNLAVDALAADYALDADVSAALKVELLTYIDAHYAEQVPAAAQTTSPSTTPPVVDDSELGVEQFEPDEMKDVIADNFAPNDLDALFGTLKNTVSDLSGRVSDVLRGGDGSGSASPAPENKPSENQPEAGMKDPTGDSTVFAVLGVAALAGTALVVSKKKAK